MNVSGIGTTGYPAWQGARKTRPNAAGKSFAAQVNNVADTPKVYNIFTDEDMIWTGGNGTGLSYYLKYAEDSTEDDPTIIAKGVDENGDEFEKTIHINEVIHPVQFTGVYVRLAENRLIFPVTAHDTVHDAVHAGIHELVQCRILFQSNPSFRGVVS